MKNNDNYNTRIIIATILSTILMVLWIRYYGGKTLPKEAVKSEAQIEQEMANEEQRQDALDIVENREDRNFSAVEDASNVLMIDTEKLKGSLSLRGLVFNNLTLENYKENINSNERVKLLSGQNTNNAYFVKFGWKSDDKSIELPNDNTLWSTNSKTLTVNNPVVLSYKNPNGVVFQLVLSIDQDYMISFKQNIINNTSSTVNVKIFNQIVKKLPGNFQEPASVHEGFIGSFNRTIEEIKYKKLKKKNFSFDDGFSWAGFTDKYWLVSIAADKNKSNLFDISTDYENGDYIIDFESQNIIVNSGEKDETSSLLFAGPKILDLLDQYAFQYDLPLFDRAVDFGWFYFLTKPIYMVLRIFYNFFGNFGVAILFLTFLVKCIMYPFTRKSYISMAKMKEAQPKIESIKTRYSDDKMKMNSELIELYKKEDISPLSGCLPMLVQIPVFFSLYKVLVISIDMRQAPFFGYIKNLAAKDPTTIWNLFGLLPYHVSFLQIGLLPCLMSLTMWIQQKMTASGTANSETQTATKLMPIIFLFLFAGMPAGLLIYWTFSNVITIFQQYYVEKKIEKLKK